MLILSSSFGTWYFFLFRSVSMYVCAYVKCTFYICTLNLTFHFKVTPSYKDFVVDCN